MRVLSSATCASSSSLCLGAMKSDITTKSPLRYLSLLMSSIDLRITGSKSVPP
ncbi:Uncharacterised protein [Vibrio cholerae]|nr:Uncharacterised protein [Vibrio cholerae]